jgi:hypothetical protein
MQDEAGNSADAKPHARRLCGIKKGHLAVTLPAQIASE